MRPYYPPGSFDEVSSSPSAAGLGASPGRGQLSFPLVDEEDEYEGELDPLLDPALPESPKSLAVAPTSACEAHAAALKCIAEGKDSQAEALLELMVAAWPSYLAAQLELACLLARRAAWPEAVERAQELLLLATEHPEQAVVEGLEPLPLTFYVAAGRALLDRATP